VAQQTHIQANGNGEETSAAVPRRPIPLEALARIQALYDASLYLQAYRAAQEFGPLKLWTGPNAQTLAARLASNLGGYRLARALHRLAYRSDPRDPDHAAYHAYTLL
jgi:hypothetical protein